MRQSVLNTFAFDLNYLKMLVDDIPEDQMCDQPAGLENHPTWSIGHLAAGCQFCIGLLGGEPTMPDGWAELFGRGSTPSPDASKYPTKAELLTELERSHQQATEAVAAADDAKMAEETPDPDFRQVAPTLSDAVVFILINHTATHLGQIAMWRRAKGLAPVLG
jgi:DinB superfamily